MKKNNKESDQLADQNNEVFDTLFDELTEAIAEESQKKASEDLDPFDIYISRIQSKIYSNIPLFRSRFLTGYKTVLKVLSNNNG